MHKLELALVKFAIEELQKDPELFDGLSPRELLIIDEYYLKGKPLWAVNEALQKHNEEHGGFDISNARIRQLTIKALRKIQMTVEAKLKDKNTCN